MNIRGVFLVITSLLLAATAQAAPPRKDICPAPANRDEWSAAARRGCEYFGETFQSAGGHSAFAADGSVITCIHFSCRAAPAKPDLTTELSSIDRRLIRYGARPWTWVHYRVRNVGTAAVTQNVYLRVLRNGAPTSGYIQVRGPIPPGEVKTGRFAVGHDAVWPPGRYQIKLEVDYRMEIDESNEANNLSNRMRFMVR